MPTQQKIKQHFNQLSQTWDQEIIPVLQDYIRIPNQSPLFDQHWEKNGYMKQAMDLIVNWCDQQPLKNKKIKLLQEKNRTPLLLIDIPGNTDKTILLYGHMDKQPAMTGWNHDLDPWKPVLKNGKLYGRGSADDGYSVFAACSAIAYLQYLNIPHARCVILIEGSEESGSIDLPFYLEEIKNDIGAPHFIICLDSECGNYEQLWSTTSLRGIIGGTLKITVLKNGLHSGYASGVVPSVFTILRILLDRLENAKTGKIICDALQVAIPEERVAQAKYASQVLGDQLKKDITFAHHTQPIEQNTQEFILNRTWRPALSIIGMNGVPLPENAGNVTLPALTVKLSMRIPPTCDTQTAHRVMKEMLEKDPPFQAAVQYDSHEISAGWNAPALSNWLAKANDQASHLFFEKPAAYLGIGGTIPFMGMLGRMFPQAQYLITGVLGPHSNAHGPNEFLHIDYVKKLTGCIASVIATHNEIQHEI